MYAGDFTWDKESQAFYMRHKLSNGQFCLIAFVRYYGKWAASISYNKKRMLIGRFATKEDAVLAHLEKESELFKDFAPQRGLLEGFV